MLDYRYLPDDNSCMHNYTDQLFICRMFLGGGLCASEEDEYGAGFNLDAIKDMLQKSGDLYTCKGT